MSQERLKENNNADHDINRMLRSTLNKMVLGVDQHKQDAPIVTEKVPPFEPKELLIINDAGLLVYRKSRIFSDMLATIKRVILGGDLRVDDEPFVIRTEKLTTLITHGNGFNIIITGSGNQINSIKLDVKQACRVITESGVMNQFSSRVTNLNAAEEAFISLHDRMPRSFSEFFTEGS